MTIIRVLNRMGGTLAAPLQAHFGPAGGTIGRSADCTLVLPDEGRHVSRRQAQVRVTAQGTTITCLSATNPLFVNGAELRLDQTRALQDGDRIQIAGYELRVEATARGPVSISAPLIPDDPFDPADPFDAPLRGAPRTDTADPLGLGSRSATDAMLDPPPGEGPLAAGHRAHRFASPEDDIDALFGLGKGGDPLAADAPLGRMPRSDPIAGSPQPPSAGGRGAVAENLDPLAAFGLPVAPMPDAPMPDHDPAISGSFRLPEAIPETTFGLSDGPAKPVVSWTVGAAPGAPPGGDGLGDPRSPGVGTGDPFAALGFGRAGPIAKDDPFARPEALAKPEALTRPEALVRPAASASSAPLPTDDPWSGVPTTPSGDPQAALQAALLRGLGLAQLPGAQPGQPAPGLTPALMERIGELLAAASHGAVVLLQARATLKQELRADLTMIGARDNNPLKFAPDGTVALQQLLAPRPVRGFMAAADAMRDAHDDLLAHQIGFVAGLGAALQGAIGRFDPAALEGRLASRSVLDAMLPMARKARLWELFNTLFAEVSEEAKEDFQALFGKAFLQAYEAQVARLEQARGTAAAAPSTPPGAAGGRAGHEGR